MANAELTQRVDALVRSESHYRDRAMQMEADNLSLQLRLTSAQAALRRYRRQNGHVSHALRAPSEHTKEPKMLLQGDTEIDENSTLLSTDQMSENPSG